MSRLETVLLSISADLSGSHARWALVGGLAVSARCEPRFTRDVDLAVAATDDHEAEQLVNDLVRRGYSVVASLEQTAVGRLASIRLAPPGEAAGGVVVDLLFASSGIESEIVAAADRLEIFPGLVLPVAAVGDLIALKLLARDDVLRPQDGADVASLIAVASNADLARAANAVALIEARGYQRDRDLVADLRRLLGHGRGGSAGGA
jgi:hypothetical protein